MAENLPDSACTGWRKRVRGSILSRDGTVRASRLRANRRRPRRVADLFRRTAPEELPPVHRRDLELAWYAARDAALAQRWGVARFFRFRRPDGSYGDLALADRDACCWADAVDGTLGLRNSYGLSVCLRLLALVDLLARERWANSLCLLHRDGADLHPSLLRAAANTPLTAEARFDESGFRTRLPRLAFRSRLGRPRGTTPDRSHFMSRLTVLLLPMLALAQCAPPPQPVGQTKADAATAAACREHADAVTIVTIATRSTRSAAGTRPTRPITRPVASTVACRSAMAATSMVRDCIRNTGTETDRDRHRGSGTSQALTWPAFQRSAASSPSATRGSSTPAA